MKRMFLALLLTLGFVKTTQASELRTVLMSSAYGAGAGALVGVTALAFSDNPGQNLNLVARGASLGLYAGLAVGIYMVSQNQSNATVLLMPSGDDVVPGLGYVARF